MKAVLLTEHSLDQASSKGKQADDRVQFVTSPVKTTVLPAIHLIKQAMACCHSATNIPGTIESTFPTRHCEDGTLLTLGLDAGEGMIGHPLDVEMFNASQWHMHESKEGSVFSSTHSSSSSPSSIGGAMELRVIKAFPFVHSLRRMSVIVKSSLDNSISLFTKARRPSPSRSCCCCCCC
jgi:magnesium-transporting ATPase (P-type)